MRQEFERELMESGYLHRPLPLHGERALESRLGKKAVIESRPLWEAGEGYPYCLPDQGQAEVVEEGSERLLKLWAPFTCPCWPKGMPEDGDCAYYGKLQVSFAVPGEDWSKSQRLRLLIRPECEGSRTISLSMYLKNAGEFPVPDAYGREGQHLLCLENHTWNECIWEFPSLPRDRIVEFGLQYRINGKDTSTGEYARFFVKAVYLEQIVCPEKEKGWLLEEGAIAYSTCGYESFQEKKAVFHTEESEFSIENREGNTILKKSLEIRKWKGDTYKVGDFSELKEEGTYRIVCGSQKSSWFPVSGDVLDEVIWKGLNFLFCERCGYPVPGKHGLCHMDVYAEHKGLKLPYCGGWHDAGDMSQQTVQTAETTESLFELAMEVKNKPLLYQRLMEEALWGLEFVLKTRFGDGYRATSLGLIRWTDGKIGNEDDAANVRVHNHALENLICAGVEALAGKCLKDYDRELSWACMKAAREDFGFGLQRFKEYGMELPIIWEHTYSSSRALYLSEIVLSAARIYEVTGEETYAGIAAEYAAPLCRCQKADTGEEIFGYFCRDEEQKTAIHYTHQSRENIPVKALTLLLSQMGGHKDAALWENAVRNYGGYVRELMKAASPYGMLPSGVYREEEAEDEETFRLLHLLVDYRKEKEHYVKQVKAGDPIGDSGFYIRQFPVWFSFRGNTAILLSGASAAINAGSYLKDKEISEIGENQIQWLFGKNPFARSLMYGVGENYEQMFSVFPGTCTGQIPVGIETKGDEDIPYWPMGNNSTYKEVWVTSVTKLFGIVSEIYKKQTNFI